MLDFNETMTKKQVWKLCAVVLCVLFLYEYFLDRPKTITSGYIHRVTWETVNNTQYTMTRDNSNPGGGIVGAVMYGYLYENVLLIKTPNETLAVPNERILELNFYPASNPLSRWIGPPEPSR